MSGTCYVFGMRAYTSATDSPGESSLPTQYLKVEVIILFCTDYFMYFVDVLISSTTQQNNIVLVSVTMSVTVVVLLLMQLLSPIYIKK